MEEENVATYFLWVDEVLNSIKSLGEELNKSVIVKKVLRSLPRNFDVKFYVVVEAKYLNSLWMNCMEFLLPMR
jgi:hypothetical protein